MAERGLSHSDLRRLLRTRRGKELPVGIVGRWLYGDRQPVLLYALQIQKLLGIPVTALAQAPKKTFSLPFVSRRRTGTDG